MFLRSILDAHKSYLLPFSLIFPRNIVKVMQDVNQIQNFIKVIHISQNLSILLSNSKLKTYFI